MSRIGKQPVAIPGGVTAQIENGVMNVKGPKGSLSMTLIDGIDYKIEGDVITIAPAIEAKRIRSYWGMQRTLVSNLMEGVTNGYSKVLEINGVGYRAQASGKKLKLQLGFSHDINLDVPEGIEVKTPDQTTIEVSGVDKQKVGQFAAEIREWRKPEPYKGKGVKYRGEYIFRKEGKKK